MSAVARPTFVVVASLLVHRATANNNDDDDEESDEHLSYSVWIDRCEARARGENRGEAPAAERLDVAGAGPRGADGKASRRIDVAGATAAPRGPGRSRRADGGAEATVAAVTYRVKSDFCPTLFTRLFLITRPEDMHVSHPLVGPHTPQLTAVKTKAA